ncbi:hypothetical protein YK48G_17300 [Lentilactobacillus fungorum]|uniref:DUF1048 domain-containing protein n=1 Tax=Lentilactobacillus fungorum TaxID=2201250 RepID=A0ABQ3VZF9_9LACO|nr:hypothetical protein [Lentilactobacillus fungorum]GHP14305.1 hypothetical protein YK48G_17300 [Lentilactobacillus fungorum]
MSKTELTDQKQQKYILYRKEANGGYFRKFNGYHSDSEIMTDLVIFYVSEMFAIGINADAIRGAVDMVIKMYEQHHQKQANNIPTATNEGCHHDE